MLKRSTLAAAAMVAGLLVVTAGAVLTFGVGVAGLVAGCLLLALALLLGWQ